MFQGDFFDLYDPHKTTCCIGGIFDMLDDDKPDIHGVQKRTVFWLGDLLEYS